jgi:hypothetical protein
MIFVGREKACNCQTQEILINKVVITSTKKRFKKPLKEVHSMDYKYMTAPCGIPCFECLAYKAKLNETIKKQISERLGLDYDKSDCDGCRNRNGKGFLSERNNIFPDGKCLLMNEKGYCKIYLCVEKRQIHNCPEFDS